MHLCRRVHFDFRADRNHRNLQIRRMALRRVDRGRRESRIIFMPGSEEFDHPRPVVIGNTLAARKFIHREPHFAAFWEKLLRSRIDIESEPARDNVAGF